MKRISTTLILALLFIVGMNRTSFSWTHIETSTAASQFPPTPVGSSSVMSYTINYMDGGSNEPVKVDVTISADGASLFQYCWDNANGAWSNFPATEWAFTAGNASRVIYIRYTPTDTITGPQGVITNTMWCNFPGAGWFLSSYAPTVALTSSPLPIQLASFTAQRYSTNSMQLMWTTVSEVNNYGFYVQVSSNKTEWTNVGAFVPGHGTTLTPQKYSVTLPMANGSWWVRLKQIDLDGTTTTSDAQLIELASPVRFALERNYPNPFNPSTTMSFAITKEGPVSLRVYDILGREVATLVNENRKPGQYTEQFNGNQVASGVYVYVLKSSEGQLTSRMILSK